jgi:DNA-binding winged helix-turn-helix (wHTH) protein/TolB-like protein
LQPERYRFGLFEFSAAARELRREGVLVRLQSQPAQVLACLLERAGQVVSRDDLRKVLWGSDTFVDFDRGLNFCISQIRSALHDNSAEPVYIRTISKHGYQFIAPAELVFERLPNTSEPNHSVASEPQSVSSPDLAAASPRVSSRTLVLACAAVLLGIVALAVTIYRLQRPRVLADSPIIAVLRFDNETGNPAMDRFTDALTDTVVEQMTAQSGGRYRVIGNALVLRVPRERRDLEAIAASLHANCVVLGQVQSNGSQQVRILAHLIRLPDQTHLSVVRTDQALGDPLSAQSSLAQKIAAEFAPRIAGLSDRSASPAPAAR